MIFSNEKFLNEIEKLNEVILAKNKEIVELKSQQQVQPGITVSLSEVKTLKIELRNYEELLSRRNAEVFRLEELLKEKQSSAEKESRLYISRRSETSGYSTQLAEELENVRQELGDKQSELARVRQQLQSSNNLQQQSQRDIDNLKGQLQNALSELDQSNELARTRVQQLEQKASDW